MHAVFVKILLLKTCEVLSLQFICLGCDCGKYSRSCSFDRFGRKNCDCYFGAIQINDYCHAIGSVSVISTTKMPSTTEFTTPRRETTTVASTTEVTSTTKFLTTPKTTSTPSVVTTEKPSTTIPTTTLRDCYCGMNSRSCRLDWFGRKICDCYHGYEQVDGYCLAGFFSFLSGHSRLNSSSFVEICNDDKCLYGKCQVLGHGYECRYDSYDETVLH
ncbi:hypothetical protein CDAR_66251 [Caerostris darwini]|uniref:EGF-like domain-containing protein n=1 Tax=Caerostris darwini TaxID=1538125 RepID=A0AAV4VW63_9ARAC|nr:hypothetical protein CDAR_66251 [Caerostris darwini]